MLCCGHRAALDVDDEASNAEDDDERLTFSDKSVRAPKSTKTMAFQFQTHHRARGQDHPEYPERFKVEDEFLRWHQPHTAYSPVEYTHPHVAAQPAWADPPDPADSTFANVLKARVTFSMGGVRRTLGNAVAYSDSGRPLNPVGRTGISGRGLLGKWGPNHAADPIVTRFHPETGETQFVAIQRRDTGQWALPGGMVDAGERVSITVKREFEEEAGAITDDDQRALFRTLTEDLFARGQVVYRGYVDDPRNTDHAWMETTAFHFHCTDELGALLPMHAGDDAAKVRWMTIDPKNPDYVELYASHREWVFIVDMELQRRRVRSLPPLNV